MKTKFAFLVSAALCIAPQASFAHHSFAAFDNAKTVTITGTVKEFQWTNPHAWIQVMVQGANGASEEWSVEGGSPNQLSRSGWKKLSLKPGDKISVKIHPLKAGDRGGSMMTVSLADGTVLGGGPPAPTPAQ